MNEVAMPKSMAERANIDSEIGEQQANLTMKLFRSAVQLAMAISGNKTDISNKALRIASPRLLSIVPEEVQDNVRFCLHFSESVNACCWPVQTCPFPSLKII